MTGHPEFEGDLELYALGVLRGEERKGLREHLATCQECGRKLEETRRLLALVALSAPQLSAPERVKDGLMRRIGSRRSGRPGAEFAGFWRWVVAALAAVSLALVISTAALKTQNMKLTRRLAELQLSQKALESELAQSRIAVELLTAPDTARVTLLSGQAKPVPQGKVFYHPAKGLLFYAADLPPLPAGKTYQLWLVPAAGNPISAGIFPVDPRGNGEVILPQLPSGMAAKAFAVTVEPAGGVPQPTGPKILIGLVS